MNRESGSGKLPVGMLVLGIAAFVLRNMLYGVAVDFTGLLPRSHPLELALTVLSGLALAAAVLAAWKQKKSGCEEVHTADIPAAVGNLAAGAGILVTVLTAGPVPGGYLENVWHGLGVAAPVCLLLAALARAQGKKPLFLLYAAVCLFFLMHIVTRYQLWSSNPQLQDYVFALLGAMGLMFFGFYTAAREAGCGNPPVRLGMGLASVYLCLVELAQSACPALYLGGLVWVLTELAGTGKTQ